MPIITSHSHHSLSELNIGSEITVTWTEPANEDTGWRPGWIYLGWGNSSGYMDVENDGESGETSTTLDTTTNNISDPGWACLEVNGYDIYGR